MYDDSFKRLEDLKDVYDHFIRDFEHRINPLQLVEIVLPVARHIFEKGANSRSLVDSLQLQIARLRISS